MKILSSKKNKNKKQVDPEQSKIKEAIGFSTSQKDMFGRKIKTQTPVLMLDDYMINGVENS